MQTLRTAAYSETSVPTWFVLSKRSFLEKQITSAFTFLHAILLPRGINAEQMFHICYFTINFISKANN